MKTLAYQVGNLAPAFFYFALFYEAIRRWNIQSIFFFCLLILNQGVNGILKTVINRPRPTDNESCSLFVEDGGLGSGMPSGHSQFFGFFLTYLTASFILKKKVKKTSSILLLILAYLLGFWSLLLRSLQSCHSPPQIFVGLFTGMILGTVSIIFIKIYKPILLY